MPELSEMTDEELLVFTRSMEAGEDVRTVTCKGCGIAFQVDNREWRVDYCEACQKKRMKEYWNRNGPNGHYRCGDGLKQGRVRRSR